MSFLYSLYYKCLILLNLFVECSPGTYWDDGACITCPVGSVQPLAAALVCDECSNGTEPNNVTVPTACGKMINPIIDFPNVIIRKSTSRQ